MTWFRRSLHLAGLSLLSLALVISPLAETKKKPKEEREGGVLGTGIVGTITALGSIMVNGQRVVFEPDMMASTLMGEKEAATLLPGETVIAVVEPAQDAWNAQAISTFVPILGPATLVDAEKIQIMGATVSLTPKTEIVGGQPLGNGNWYAVSGLWQGANLVASRIEPVDPMPFASTSGSFFLSEDGTPHVGGVALQGDVATGLELENGAATTFRGTPMADGLNVTLYRSGLFETDVSMIIAEGYLSSPDAGGMYTVLGSGVRAVTDNPAMIDPNARGVFCARAPVEGQFGTISPMTGEKCE